MFFRQRDIYWLVKKSASIFVHVDDTLQKAGEAMREARKSAEQKRGREEENDENLITCQFQ